MSGGVVIVEDHALLAETLSIALQAHNLAVTIAPLTEVEAVLHAVDEAQPDLVLLDLDLGPLGDGVDLVPRLTERGAAVLVVTGVRNTARLGAAIAAGAIGYLTKDQPFDALVDTIRRAAHGGSVLDLCRRQELLDTFRRARSHVAEVRAPFAALTTREKQVLAALGEGKSVDAIAAEWFVSRATVRTQVRGVLTKLEVGTQLAAVAKARRAGWLR